MLITIVINPKIKIFFKFKIIKRRLKKSKSNNQQK